MGYSKGIIYYSSSTETPEFEKKIQDIIKQNCGDMPIVSVTQKPADMGINICIGEVGKSYQNEFRQILIAARNIDTDYIIFCEADFLYPPEYFQFSPTGENVYRYDNVWLVFNKSNIYYKKNYSNGAMICKRDFVVESLKKFLTSEDPWVDWEPSTYFSGEVPCVSFRTGKGMTSKSHFLPGPENKCHILPMWGNARELKQQYFNG